jgi:hypothetical protein
MFCRWRGGEEKSVTAMQQVCLNLRPFFDRSFPMFMCVDCGGSVGNPASVV